MVDHPVAIAIGRQCAGAPLEGQSVLERRLQRGGQLEPLAAVRHEVEVRAVSNRCLGVDATGGVVTVKTAVGTDRVAPRYDALVVLLKTELVRFDVAVGEHLDQLDLVLVDATPRWVVVHQVALVEVSYDLGRQVLGVGPRERCRSGER